VTSREEQNWSLPANEEPVFGNIDPEMIQRAYQPFQPSADNQAAIEMFQQMVSPYLRDGMRADKEQDPPDNVWLKIRFLMPHSEDVDSTTTVGAVTGSQDFFDRGLANVPLLQRGGKATFEPGDVAIFPRSDAENLIGQGLAEEIEPIFVRKLNSYDFSLREMSQRLARLNVDIEGVKRDTVAVTETNRRTLEQIQFREMEKTRLQTDQAKFQYELAQLTALSETLNQTWLERRADLSRLYRENHQLLQELIRIDEELTRQINERTLEAVNGQ
jgi:hypothetical protein